MIAEIERQSWERAPGEGLRAFEAFCAYRDKGVNRSIRSVAQELSKSIALIGRWSTTHQWVDRVSAWDDEQDRLKRLKHAEAIEEMNERHVRIAKMLQSKAIEKLTTMTGDNNKLAPKDVQGFLALAAQLERVAMGAPTDIHEINDETGPGRMARKILDNPNALEKALELLDEVATKPQVEEPLPA